MIEFFNHVIQGTATWSQLSFVPREIRSNKSPKSSWITTNHNGRFHHRRKIYDRSAIKGLFLWENWRGYEDNSGKLRFAIKVKMHLRFTRNGRLRIYEDNKFPFTVYEDNKSVFTVYEDTPLAPQWLRFKPYIWINLAFCFRPRYVIGRYFHVYIWHICLLLRNIFLHYHPTIQRSE